ncbi:MAG: glutamine--fructose-6-phosphate transaminase (isomerizing) [Chloroflexota bacterium]|nr:glutamine--fructose-6-phosphate transaminase (isomerizing) [Chloroflexota bacterium]
MCGIVGYIGKDNALSRVRSKIKLLEYRGYDSSGFCVIDSTKNEFLIKKTIGTIDKIKNIPDIESSIGISHTRWATHGKISESNAHPQLSQNNQISIVHNGIIENYQELKLFLKNKGYSFNSETDTEVACNLIEFFLQTNDFEKALIKTLDKIEGSSSIVGININQPKKIFIIKKGNSGGLVVSQSGNEKIISSDPTILKGFADSYRYLVNNEIAILDENAIQFIKEQSGKESRIVKLENQNFEDINDIYQYKMEEEIHFQPKAIENIKNNYSSLIINKIEDSKVKFDEISRILIVGMGSSFNAGYIGSYYFENLSKIPSQIINASEFIDSGKIIHETDLVIGITQSGETAETIKALEYAKNKKAKTLAIVEKSSSQASIISDLTVNIGCGSEYAVASTKTFTSTTISLYILSKYIYSKKQNINFNHNEIAQELDELNNKVALILNNQNKIKEISKRISKLEHILFLGRDIMYPVAMEGALKMKEVCYIHAEAYPAGEMKHGVNALIGEKMPSLVMAPTGNSFNKMLSTVNEIKARDGKVIGLTDNDSNEFISLLSSYLIIDSFNFNLDVILYSINLQLLSFYTSLLLKINPDRPRNLAKTVTVE